MANFFQELKRRKVFRVAAIYAVGAWLLIQVADTVAPLLNLPEITPRLVLFLLLILFPVALFLAWAYELSPEGVRTLSAGHPDPEPPAPHQSDRRLLYATFGLVLLVAAFQISDRFLVDNRGENDPVGPSTTTSSDRVIQFAIPLGEGQDQNIYLGDWANTLFGRPSTPAVALSNDGRTLYYSGWSLAEEVESRIYARRLDRERANPVLGTESAISFFLSADSESIGFFTSSARSGGEYRLNRVPASGGNVEVIATVQPDACCGAWSEDGTIVYSAPLEDDSSYFGLYRLPANGGEPELLVDPRSSASELRRYSRPHFLPDGNALLFHGTSVNLGPEFSEILVLNLQTGLQSTLFNNGSNPHYLVESGHLLFVREGMLMGAGLDEATLTLTSDEFVLAENIMHALNMPNFATETGIAQFAVSRTGDVVYASGGKFPDLQIDLMEVQQVGDAQEINLQSFADLQPIHVRLSPDQRRLAVSGTLIGDQRRERNLYVIDLERDVATLIDIAADQNRGPIWSPDGERLLFSSNLEDGILNIYTVSVDGSDETPQRLSPSSTLQVAGSWSQDGTIAYVEGGDIWVIPPGRDPEPFVDTAAVEWYPTFSPDGRWLAYTASTETAGGVYVRPFPGPGPAITLSSAPNVQELAWSKDGAKLYFSQEDSLLQRWVMMSVDFNDGQPSRAQRIIDDWHYTRTLVVRSYDVSADDTFFALLLGGGFVPDESGWRQTFRSNELHLMMNFSALLRERTSN